MKSLNLKPMPRRRRRAVPLEVAARPGDDRLRRELGDPPVGEVDDRLLALVEVLGAVDADDVRGPPLDRVPLGLQVVPDEPKCSSGASATISISLATRAARLSRFSRAASTDADARRSEHRPWPSARSRPPAWSVGTSCQRTSSGGSS
jgi:hypothetical protein